jgi:alpha 1,2-mannosyltransferase
MQDEKKVYGFTLSLFEYIETIPTLWDTVKGTSKRYDSDDRLLMDKRRSIDFIRENPQYVPEDNAMQFISDDGGESYNKCHFWSNFEIGAWLY